MAMFWKSINHLKVEVGEPSPRWWRIVQDRGDKHEIYGLEAEDVRDLIYALQASLDWAEAEDVRQKELSQR